MPGASASSGSILRQDRQLHAILGYMPQKFGLYEDLTVMENLNLYASLRGVVGAERQRTFERMLAFTSLAPSRIARPASSPAA